MNRRGVFRASLYGAALALSLTLPAAADRDQARAHYDRALAHIQAKQLDQALAELRQAFELHPHYAVLYNMALVHGELGDDVSAVEALERYRELGGSNIPPQRRVEVQNLLARHMARVAELSLSVAPAGASIRIDGKDVGKSPLPRPLVLRGGRRELSVALAGHRSERRILDLRGGSKQELSVELTPLSAAKQPARVTMDIDCPVPGVVVKLDGKPVAKTPVASVVTLAGQRDVVFERPGYVSSRQFVTAQPDARTLARCSLQPLEPLPSNLSGTVVLDVAVPHTAFIDGELLAGSKRVPIGRHRLRVQAAGYVPWAQDVVVEPSRALRVRPPLEPDADTVRSREAQRTWAYALGINGAGLLLVAGAIYVWNDSRYQDWQRHQQDLDAEWRKSKPLPSDLVKRQTENDELFEAIKSFDAVTVGLGFAGGVLLTTGVLLYVTGDSPSAGRPVVALAPRASEVGWSFAW